MAVAPPAPVLLTGQQALLVTLGKGSPERSATLRPGSMAPWPARHPPGAYLGA